MTSIYLYLKSDLGYVYMTAGLKPTRVEISRVFTRGGLESARRIQQAVFLPPEQFFEKGSCKVHDESFQPGLNYLHAFSAFFNPG